MENPLTKYFKWETLPLTNIQECISGSWESNYGNPLPIPVKSPEQLIGIEVEIERALPNKVASFIPTVWINQVEDGSLRNNGIEFVTCPHEVKYTETLLGMLFKHLPEKAEFTPRTSIHVHFNVRDMSIEQVSSVLYTYLAVEKLLYRWVGVDREKSIFCVPIQETVLMSNFGYLISKNNIRALSWMKYTGLNVLPIREKGTIEFRHLYGTKDLNRILLWINLISCIMEYAKKTPADRVINTILELNSNSEYRTFVEEVFQEYSTELTEFRDCSKLVEKGVNYIKSQALHNEYKVSLISGAEKDCELWKRLHGNRVVKTRKDISWDTFQVNLSNTGAFDTNF